MPRYLITKLRLLAATLVLCAGTVRVASLWFRELDEQAVLTLLVGAVYLILGIGLFGQSRFSLFAAILICSATSLLALNHFTLPAMLPLQLAAIGADAVTVACCTLVLWQVRKEPSI